MNNLKASLTGKDWETLFVAPTGSPFHREYGYP